MEPKLKLSNKITMILGFVLAMAFVLQISRSDMLLRWSGEGISSVPSGLQEVDALSAAEVAKLKQDKTLLVYDPKERYSLKIKNNAEMILHSMKRPYETVAPDRLPSSLNEYSMIIMTITDLGQLSDVMILERYVEQGGHLFFAATPDVNSSFYRLYRKLGIYEVGEYLVTKDIELTTNVLFNAENTKFSGTEFEGTSIYFELEDRCTVLARTTNDIPMLWKVQYGEGTFMVFNGTMLQEKASRGFFSGAIGMLMPDFIYPVMNMKLMYIDDFPAPFPQGFNVELYKIYKRNIPRFFKEVWWPDMLRLARNYDLKYTGVAIESYNKQVTPPFKQASDSEINNLIIYGRELIKSGGEIGLHGFNHQSLTVSAETSKIFDYKPWKSTEDMTASIASLEQYIHQVYPNYKIRTYVPPSNVIDKFGREALKKGAPTLTNISSVYIADADNRAYHQEFSVAEDGIVELPRITSGFKIADFDKWTMMNAVSSIGVFSHFVHPDDIIDYERSFPYNWAQLYERLQQFLSFVSDEYGWLRSMTASQASEEVKAYEASSVYFEHKPDRINGYINHFSGGMYFMLRTDKKINRQQNCTVKLVDEQLYIVHATKEKFEIGLGG